MTVTYHTGIQLLPLEGIPEIHPGDDLAAIIGDAAGADGLQARDILVVTHKVVSKAEGRLVDLREIEPSPLAERWAALGSRDPRQVEVVLRESKRVVRMVNGLTISETQHGFVCANAGVDASNVPGEHMVCLLPEDPDASARRLRDALSQRFSVPLAIIISDSFGRPWRNGIVNIAIGVAGLLPLTDYRGQTDPYGYIMHASVLAVADELAAAAELVMGKIDKRPVAVIRGYPWQPGPGAGKDLIMDSSRDMFR